MKDHIIHCLEEIERLQNCRIILAVESGSRAWGFASPDSDYDVRFIYVRPKNDYLQLQPSRDVIELPVNDVLDINGWDLSKALRLMHRSNPTLTEWLSSPITYSDSRESDWLKSALHSYFAPRETVYHYLNMAKGNYKSCLRKEMVNAKKYFYVLRPLLAAKWVLQHQSPPPMLFDELMDSQLEPEMHPFVQDLLDLKRSTSEISHVPRIDVINNYLDVNLVLLEKAAEAMPKTEPHDWNALNDLFLKILEV